MLIKECSKTCLEKLHELRYFMIFVHQPSYYQIWVKVITCQTDSVLTLSCQLYQSGFSVLSVKLIIKSKICFLCTYVNQMIIEQRFNVLLKLQFYSIFTNVLSIIFKSFHQFYVSNASNFGTIPQLILLKMCPRAQKTLLALNLSKA